MTTRTRIAASLAALAAAVLGPMAATAAAAAAQPAAATNLRHGWGANEACLVHPDGKAECFSTVAAMRARSAQLAATTASFCPVTLYSGTNYTGQALELTGQGYWINLSDYGFDNVTVSFIGTGCGFHLAQGQYGAGYWYPGNTGPWASSPDMGPGWDDTVSSTYIN